MQEEYKKKKKIRKSFIVIIVCIVIVALFFVFRGKFKNKTPLTETDKTAINIGDYFAVFLVNNQVYFGNIVDDDKYMVLNNVYYLQVPPGKTEPQLVKLGNEIHAPTDEIFINRNQIVFYEKLRSDSPVIKSIQATSVKPN